MADDPIVDTLDADLAAIMTAPPTEVGAEPRLGETPPIVGDPPVADPAVADPLAALETIEEPKPDEAPKSTLTAEQERILTLVPSSQVAEQVQQTVTNYNNFTSTFASGNYEAVEGMLEAWNPAALEGFLEHIYAKRVASGEWVDRWIADKEGDPTTNKAVSRLERQIQQLQSELKGRSTQEQQQVQQARANQVFADYNAHVDGLFDKIKFAAGDRKWVATDLKERVSNSPQVKQAVLAGNMTAVNSLFKQAVREYVERDKATAQVKAGVLEAQAGKKPLLQSAPQADGVLPDNVKEVPKDKLDQWQDEQLANLFAGKKKR